MPDGDPSASGAEPVAAETEVPSSSMAILRSFADLTQLSIAQMVQAIKDQYTEIQRIGNLINLLLEAWQLAAYRWNVLKRRLDAWHPGKLDAEDVDPDHVARLTRAVQADKYEGDLLSAIMRRLRQVNGMVDGLEELAVKLKVKAWADGDSEAHDLVQQTEYRMRECRRETYRVAEQIIEQRKEIMGGR